MNMEKMVIIWTEKGHVLEGKEMRVSKQVADICINSGKAYEKGKKPKATSKK